MYCTIKVARFKKCKKFRLSSGLNMCFSDIFYIVNLQGKGGGAYFFQFAYGSNYIVTVLRAGMDFRRGT